MFTRDLTFAHHCAPYAPIVIPIWQISARQRETIVCLCPSIGRQWSVMRHVVKGKAAYFKEFLELQVCKAYWSNSFTAVCVDTSVLEYAYRTAQKF